MKVYVKTKIDLILCFWILPLTVWMLYKYKGERSISNCQSQAPTMQLVFHWCKNLCSKIIFSSLLFKIPSQIHNFDINSSCLLCKLLSNIFYSACIQETMSETPNIEILVEQITKQFNMIAISSCLYSFSVAKATLESQMSVCPLVIKCSECLLPL